MVKCLPNRDKWHLRALSRTLVSSLSSFRYAAGRLGTWSNQILKTSVKTDDSRLNLTAANHVFLMEPQWNPMVEDQALDRVHRIGQEKEVTTVRYIVNNTLEEVRPCQHHDLIPTTKELTWAKSIRHQQLKKRNLAEQAFALARGHNDWVKVSHSYKETDGSTLIEVYSVSARCCLTCHHEKIQQLAWRYSSLAHDLQVRIYIYPFGIVVNVNESPYTHWLSSCRDGRAILRSPFSQVCSPDHTDCPIFTIRI